MPWRGLETGDKTIGNTIHIGIGSNSGNKEENCLDAIDYLRRSPAIHIKKTSSLYLTEPYGFRGQEWFVNCVIAGTTTFSPRGLLEFLKDYERRMGRRGGERWGPRVIDLDILFYSNGVVDDPDLKIPHPDLGNRLFVLIPLAEISPELLHPLLKRSIAEILSASEREEKVIPLPLMARD